jgi:hypothetical protein
VNHEQKNTDVGTGADRSGLGRAVQTLFVPLARLLVRTGFSASGAMESIHRAYVVATSEFFREKDWPVTSARLAVFTGLTRHHVERIQGELSESTEIEPSKFNQITRLLTTWHLDSRFVMPMLGEPRDLPFSASPREVSFQSLVRECAPFLDAQELLDELHRLGAITIHGERGEEKDGRSEGERKMLVRVRHRAFVPEPYDATAIERLGRIFAALAETLDGNFSQKGTSAERFERNVNADFAISPEDEAAFSAMARQLGQKALEDLDGWLATRKRVPENGRRVGVEIFHFVETGISDSSEIVEEETSFEPSVIDTLNFKKD